MVGYYITHRALRQLIRQHDKTWLSRARKRTVEFRAMGTYDEISSIWGEVKDVYIALQPGKCVFCERKMESPKRGGRIEQDVEHFRPKGSVKRWKAPKAITDAGIVLSAVPAGPTGYHLLPYHVLNYAAACKPCNSILKKDFFPISGSYRFDESKPRRCESEKPFLIYPIGEIDRNPEELIEFDGPSPKAKATTGFDRQRALVTIEFFRLDDPTDPSGLYHGRSMMISGLFPLLEDAAERGGPSQARQVVEDLPLGLPHLNCARSFCRLYLNERATALAFYEAA